MAMLAAALFLDYFFVHRAAAVANEARITEDMALTLRTVGWVEWSLVLFALNGCTFFLIPGSASSIATGPMRSGASGYECCRFAQTM
ncbi:MAG TPA: hypothetical protein VGK48_17655 [Terriglobia bacterium]|jgi:hypothetical protein